MVTFGAAAFSYTYYQELLVFLLTAIKKFTFPLGISQKVDSEAVSLVGAGGGGGFLGYVPLASQSSYPIIVYFKANYTPILVTFGQISNFQDPNLVTFFFLWIEPFFFLNEKHFTFHLQYKHSGTFANRKCEEPSYPQKSLNVWPHSSNSIENATPL